MDPQMDICFVHAGYVDVMCVLAPFQLLRGLLGLSNSIARRLDASTAIDGSMH